MFRFLLSFFFLILQKFLLLLPELLYLWNFMNVEDHYLIFLNQRHKMNGCLYPNVRLKCIAEKKISSIIIIRRVCAWFRRVSLKIADACFKEMSRWICEHRLTTSIYKMDELIGGWMKNKNIHKVIDSLDSFLAAWKLWRSSVASVGVFMSIYFFLYYFLLLFICQSVFIVVEPKWNEFSSV